MTIQEDPVFVYIEDDAPSRQIVQVLLTRVLKYKHLTVFENTTDVIEKLRAITPPPSIILLDIQIRPHDGYEVLQMVRADSVLAHTTVIALTANVMANDVDRLREVGFDGLIGKPIVNDLFPKLVKQILEKQPVWFIP